MSVEHAQSPHAIHSQGLELSPGAGDRQSRTIAGNRIAVDVVIAFEALVTFAVGLAIAEVYVGGVLGFTDYFGQYLAPLLVLPLMNAAILNYRGLHRFARLCHFAPAIGPLGAGITLGFAIVMALGVAAGVAGDYSRAWFAGWYVAALFAVMALRAVVAHLISRLSDAGYLQKTVVIYGFGAPARQVAEAIKRSHQGIRLVGIFEPQPESADGEVRDTAEEFVAYARSRAVDTVIVALPAEAAPSINRLLGELSVLPGAIQLHMDFGTVGMPARADASLDHLPLLEIRRRPISDWGVLVKRVEDCLVAGLAMVLLAPLFALIALAIKLDSRGPVFFIQRRHGYNNEIIRVWKFRTMRVMEDGDDFVQARRDDDRVTRVGRLLRRTSLDELPQLINVLRGEMSVVGPRPHPLALNSRFEKILTRYMDRHRVKPGITGWAQINGFRGPTEDPELMRKRVEHDLQYIENWSLIMDVGIIIATPFVGLINKNAI